MPKIKITKDLVIQFSLYLAVGVSNTALTAIIMLFLAKVGFHYVLYTTIGYGAGFINSYYWNSRLTFRTKSINHKLLMRFFAVNIGLLLAVQSLQILLIELIKTPEIVAVIIGMATYTFGGFFANRCLLTTKKEV